MTPTDQADQRILIVTYYWPPDGGPGVQRWLKFVKYLPSLGWKPIVFTPENSSFTITDPSLAKDIPAEAEILKIPIWEPHQLFFKASSALGKKKLQQSDFLASGKQGFFKRLSLWIRGNLFIPDARVFWIGPATRFLATYIQQHKIKYLVTTGPPHSLHLIGLRLKKKFPSLHWVADFRDPWSEWDMLDSLSVTDLAKKVHRRQELTVLKTADTVITISPRYAKRFSEMSNRPVELITNGFDEDDFKDIERIQTQKFTIRHVGNIDDLRDPRPVMEAIKRVCLRNPEFQNFTAIEFVGNVNSAFKEFVAADFVLSSITRFVSHLPHGELVKLYGSTDLQLLVMAHLALATGNIPGKVFEYLASGNPILALGAKDGDVDQILQETKAGKVFDRGEGAQISAWVEARYVEWKNQVPNTERNVRAFSRRAMTERLVGVLPIMLR